MVFLVEIVALVLVKVCGKASWVFSCELTVGDILRSESTSLLSCMLSRQAAFMVADKTFLSPLATIIVMKQSSVVAQLITGSLSSGGIFIIKILATISINLAVSNIGSGEELVRGLSVGVGFYG